MEEGHARPSAFCFAALTSYRLRQVYRLTLIEDNGGQEARG